MAGTATHPMTARPRFYPGQVLTDRDLNALVDWVRGRFALGRFWDGWGAVHGLDVTASADGRTLSAGPGVAIDPAGMAVEVRAGDETSTELPTVADLSGRCSTFTEKDEKIVIGPYTAESNRWAVFDLVLVAAAVGEQPWAVPGCGPRQCEDGRTRDGGELHLLRADWPQKPDTTSPPDSRPEVDLLKRFSMYKAEPGKTYPGAYAVATVIDELTKELAAQSALGRTLPGLAGWLKSPDGEREVGTPWGLARVLGWMADAVRRGPPAGPDPVLLRERDEARWRRTGVPLARVWAKRYGSRYEARYIDPSPPHRRPFGPDPTAGLDPRAYTGWAFELAQDELRRRGVTVTDEPAGSPADAAALLNLYDDEPMFVPGTDAVARVRDWPGDGVGRVVAFDPTAGELIPLKPEKTLKVELRQAPTSPTAGVTFADDPGSPVLPAIGVPRGGWVQLVIEPNSVLADFKDCTFALHTDLDGKLQDVLSPDKTKFIVATVQAAAGGADLKAAGATLVIRKGKAAVALTSILGGGSTFTVQVDPLKVMGLEVVPVGAGAGSPIIRLTTTKPAKFPLAVTVSDMWPHPATGEFHYAKEKPTKPDDGEKNDVSLTPIATVPPGGKKAKLTDAVVADLKDWTAVYVWLQNGVDVFRRPFALPPTDVNGFVGTPAFTPVPIKDIKLEVSIVIPAGAFPAPATLTLTNNHATETVKVTGGTVRQPATDRKATETNLATGDIDATKSNSTTFPAVDGTTACRVSISFQIGTDSHTAILDVTPT